MQRLVEADTQELLSPQQSNKDLCNIHEAGAIPDKLVTELAPVEFTVDVWLMWSRVWPLTL